MNEHVVFVLIQFLLLTAFWTFRFYRISFSSDLSKKSTYTKKYIREPNAIGKNKKKTIRISGSWNASCDNDDVIFVFKIKCANIRCDLYIFNMQMWTKFDFCLFPTAGMHTFPIISWKGDSFRLPNGEFTGGRMCALTKIERTLNRKTK